MALIFNDIGAFLFVLEATMHQQFGELSYRRIIA
jgi:hypothetical protein